MVESLSSRLWRTIPLILIVVLFSSLAYGEVIYVDDDATGANDGKNWENAYKYLQDALADAESAEKPVEIRVAQGIYKPDQGANQTPGDRVANFRLINGVTLEGSYAGFGHDDPNDRDVAGFITSDLAGEWFLGGSDIQGDHTWDGLLIIDSDGTITGGTLENSDGLTYTSISGDLTINDTGKVTGQVLYSNGIKILLTMQMNKSKGVVAGEGNEQIYKEDGVFIFVKTSSGFMTSDLEGEWFLSGSDIQGDHTWDGLVILNSEGKVAGGILESSDGPVYTFVGGDLAINSTGKVTGQITDSNGVTTQMTMQMDKSKGNIAGEGNAELDDQDGVFFFVKKTSGFTTSDLEGYWSLGGSDIQGDHTRDGFLLIDDEGNVIGGMIASSEGPVYTFIGGDLSINSTGKVIGQVTDSDGVTTQLTMHMNENKDIVAGEGNAQGDDEDGIFVFVRISSRYNTVLSGDLLGNDAVVDDPCDMLNEPNRADNSYHVVYGREVDSSAILDGFTVTGGKGLEGGGIYLSSHSEPTVSNCRFYANSAYRGGAIAISNVGKPTISNCMFISNSATTSGGAIYADDRGSAIVTNCIFIDNYAPFDGGAVYMSQICRQVYTDCMFLRNKAGAGGAIVDRYANVTTYVRCSFIENSATTSGGAYHLGSLREENFTDCSFVRNESNHSGGGVTIWGGKANFTRCIFHENTSSNGGGLHFTSCMYRSTIEDCEFIKNTTRGNGGGINLLNSSAVLTGCKFTENIANHGGGLSSKNYNFEYLVVKNCMITGNKASTGGGILVRGDTPVSLYNCTISGNRADYGAGVNSSQWPEILMQNCIVWGNEVFIEGEIYNISKSNIRSCNIAGGWIGEGNIDANPFFVTLGYWDFNETLVDPNDDIWIKGDYRLTPCSPCIDSGDPNYISGPNETDLDGNSRVIGGRIDMGAYEYPFVYDKPDEGTTPGNWRRYSENPVFLEAGFGEWDYRITSVSAMKDHEAPVAKYEMWYVGGETQFIEGAGIGYATSSDGINWVRNENNPALEPGEWWNAEGFSGICVIKDGPIYKLWYEGSDNDGTARIGYATSSDGISWDINNSNPVFSPGDNDAWDNEDVGNPCVIKEGSTYKMWYWGDDKLVDIDQIGLAVSDDGINWQRVSSEPVVAPDPGIWWQNGEGIGTPHVIRVNSGYLMAYHAADQIGNIRIGLATSSDGLDWKKENEPILDIGDENSWESIGIVTGSFIQDTLHLKLWYLGIDASETIKVGLAISCDDIVFDVEADN